MRDEATHDADAGRKLLGLAAGLGVTIVAVAATLLFALSRTDDPGRVVSDVVALAALPTEDPPPAAAPPARPRDLPGFAAAAGWRPVGERLDRIAGREARTVVYTRFGRRIAHTELAGDPLSAPPGARRNGRGGILLHSFDEGGQTVVLWRADGRTHVLSSGDLARGRLYDLAAGPVDD